MLEMKTHCMYAYMLYFILILLFLLLLTKKEKRKYIYDFASTTLLGHCGHHRDKSLPESIFGDDRSQHLGSGTNSLGTKPVVKDNQRSLNTRQTLSAQQKTQPSKKHQSTSIRLYGTKQQKVHTSTGPAEQTRDYLEAQTVSMSNCDPMSMDISDTTSGDLQQPSPSSNSGFSVTPLSISEVQDELTKLNSNKSADLDGLNPTFPKPAAHIITTTITRLFNMVLQLSKFPSSKEVLGLIHIAIIQFPSYQASPKFWTGHG